VGGQKTLRSYWRNYFEKTDALIWVVDSTDRLRIDDCRVELQGLLQEEVRMDTEPCPVIMVRACRVFVYLADVGDSDWPVPVY
jgi:GTPase SAR1 family protein